MSRESPRRFSGFVLSQRQTADGALRAARRAFLIGGQGAVEHAETGRALASRAVGGGALPGRGLVAAAELGEGQGHGLGVGGGGIACQTARASLRARSPSRTERSGQAASRRAWA